ncbi:hypothetical protein J6590_005429, partial [Homalodisca vitripennis]
MMLRIPEVKSCCCCLSLRTGAKLFGFMALVSIRIRASQFSGQQRVCLDGLWLEEAIAEDGVPQGLVLEPLLFLLRVNDFPYSIQATTLLYANDPTFGTYSNLEEFKMIPKNTLDDAKWFNANAEHADGNTTLLALDISAHSIQMVTSIVLLLHVYQASEKAKLIPWWLVSTFFMAILEVLFIPSFFIRLTFDTDFNTFDLRLILISLFLTIDDIYGCLVVYSYYRTLSPPRCEPN